MLENANDSDLLKNKCSSIWLYQDSFLPLHGII